MPQGNPHFSGLTASTPFVVFQVDQWTLALPLEAVQRVLPVMEAMRLPGAPPAIAGIIRIDEGPIPVVDLRTVLGSPSKRVEPLDVLLLVTTPVRQAALWVDRVEGVRLLAPEDLLQSLPLFGENRIVHQVMSKKDDLILIYNLEEVLTAEDETALKSALDSLQNQE